MNVMNWKFAVTGMMVLWAGAASAASATGPSNANDLLVKFADEASANAYAAKAQSEGAKVENLGGAGNWLHVKVPAQRSMIVQQLSAEPSVRFVQPNYKMHLLTDYRVKDPAARAELARLARHNFANRGLLTPDNPPLPTRILGGQGADPDLAKQWGMLDIGVQKAWSQARGAGVVVAVIDTGVDYTHPDLVDNLWRNPGETGTDAQGHDKSSNGIDDDANGFVDDVIGWDFASNDNKPYDLAVQPIDLLMGGGNPGHGTHCAGNVAARGNNGVGISGVAPEAKIMAMRFLTEKGEGSNAEAIKAINYAVKMGANVLSNSWGSEGEEPGEENQALKDAIENANAHNVIFIAAAGNGHSGVGYDNDSDAKPGIPASYSIANIVSVAAVDNKDALGSFSNWGLRTVHLGAPGVAIYSTTVTGKYSDTVIDMYGFKATWDGTSMATPHVAGAAALYLSKHPNASVREVKEALISSAKPISALNGKSVSGGKLNVEALLNK